MVNSLGSVLSMQMNVVLTSPNILDALFTALDTCIWNFRSRSMVIPKFLDREHLVALNPISGTNPLTDLCHPGVVDSPYGNSYSGRTWCHLQISLQYM